MLHARYNRHILPILLCCIGCKPSAKQDAPVEVQPEPTARNTSAASDTPDVSGDKTHAEPDAAPDTKEAEPPGLERSFKAALAGITLDEATCVGEEPLPCDPVLWLSRCSRAQLGEHYCKACEKEDACQVEGEERAAFTLVHDDLDGMPCEELGWMTAALEHYKGVPLSDKTWAPLIKKAPWYKQRGTFAPVGDAQLEQLRLATKACEAAPSSPTLKEREAVTQWMQTIRDKKVLPKGSKVFTEGHLATQAEFIDQLFQYEPATWVDRRTPIRVEGSDFEPWEEELDLDYDRVLLVLPSFRGHANCVLDHGEACHAFEHIHLYLDEDGKIIGQAMITVACPYVYVLRGGEWTRIGEVLRDLRHVSLRKTQSLDLGTIAPGEDGTLHIMLAEEKDEITYLDAVWLERDGERVYPASCAESSRDKQPLAHCEIDGEDLIMHRGDELELRFELPDTRPARWELVAHGHYEPR